MSKLPICKSGADLAHLDGQRVVVSGIYRKRLVAKRMGQPETTFNGRAQIELAGKASDYDERLGDRPPIVRLDVEKRPAEEVEKLEGKPVTVEGRLVVKPAPADPNVATTYPEPTLFELGPVTPR